MLVVWVGLSTTTTTTHAFFLVPHRSPSVVPFRLSMATIRITTPSSEEAVEMGIREWPNQVRQGKWSEFVPSETTVIRYVLEGSGTLEMLDQDQATTQTTSLVPGTLMEITGTASLQWSCTSKDMILLTPNFEQGGLLVGVVLSIIVLFGALLAGVVL